MESILIFIALIGSAVWLTTFICGARLSLRAVPDEYADKLFIVCIVATVIIGIALTTYAAITNL